MSSRSRPVTYQPGRELATREENPVAQRVHLNGGPLHDHTYTIPNDQVHIHVAGVRGEVFREILEGHGDSVSPSDVKSGRYSRVQGYPGEFEWDGWDRDD